MADPTKESDWSELVAAIPDGWELRESAQLEEVSRERQRDLEASQATTARWRARAEKAEATIARVEKLAAEYARDDQEHLSTFGQHHPVAGIAHDHLRAALEGEQQ